MLITQAKTMPNPKIGGLKACPTISANNMEIKKPQLIKAVVMQMLFISLYMGSTSKGKENE